MPNWGGGGVRGEFGKRPHFFRVFFSHPSLTASVCRPWSTDVSNKAETTERGYIVPLDELTQQAGCLNEKVKAREVSTPTILTSWTRLPRSWSWPKRSKLWTKWCFESTILSLPSGDEDGHIANLATQGHNVVLDRKPCCGYNYADWLLVVTCTPNHVRGEEVNTGWGKDHMKKVLIRSQMCNKQRLQGHQIWHWVNI